MLITKNNCGIVFITFNYQEILRQVFGDAIDLESKF